MKLTFRNAVGKDFPFIKDIATKGWLFAYGHLPKRKLIDLVNKYYSEKSLKASLKKKGTDLFIVVESHNNKIIGFCHVTAKNRNGELLRLYIDTGLIGKGIGKRLLRKGEAFLKKKDCKKYFTFVNKNNTIGLSFYERNSFLHKQKRDREDEFNKGKVLWYMEKTLS